MPHRKFVALLVLGQLCAAAVAQNPMNFAQMGQRTWQAFKCSYWAEFDGDLPERERLLAHGLGQVLPGRVHRDEAKRREGASRGSGTAGASAGGSGPAGHDQDTARAFLCTSACIDCDGL